MSKRLAVAFAGLALAGCSGGGATSSPPIVTLPPTGASGTTGTWTDTPGPGAGSSSCGTPPVSTMDAGAAAVLAVAQGRHLVDGTWGNGSGTVATIDVTVGEQLATSTTGCGGALQVGAIVTVKTRDGLIDAHGTTLTIDYLRRASLEIPLPDLPVPAGVLGSYSDPKYFLVRQNISSTDHPTLVVSFSVGQKGFSADAARAVVVVGGESVVGAWSSAPLEVPPRREPQYEVPAELVTACAPAVEFTNAPSQFTVLPTADAARAARVGTWSRCHAYGGPAHEGIQIAADGTWSYLRYGNGSFVTSPGLRRAGTIQIISGTISGPGFAQVNLAGPGVSRATWVSGSNRLILQDDTAPPDWGVSVYVRTDRPVTSAQNTFAAGQRAGAAACAVGELGTIDPDLGAPLDTILAGDWTVCSGEFLEGYRRLRFDGHGGLAFVDEAGAALPSRPFEALRPETTPPQVPRYTILQSNQTPEGPDDWTIILSERPLKMWVFIESQHAVKRELVLSALPPQ
jgi:hypothetical protein